MHCFLYLRHRHNYYSNRTVDHYEGHRRGKTVHLNRQFVWLRVHRTSASVRSNAQHLWETQPFILAVSLFTLGSGVAGSAKNAAMLIGGRAVQDVGAVGTYLLLDVVLCDIVPLRQRAKYLGLMLSTTAIGTTVGPFIGGGFAEANWCWMFYLDLPFFGLALAPFWFFSTWDIPGIRLESTHTKESISFGLRSSSLPL